MKKSMLSALLFLCSVVAANATVLTFEDLPGGSAQVPFGYGGFNWTSPSVVGSVLGHTYPGSGYDIGTIGNVSIVNLGATSPVNIDLVGSGIFTFNGAQFTAAWENHSMQFFGYNNGSLVYTSNFFNISTASPTWIELDWSGINRLQIIDTAAMHFDMDNFTFNESASAVPEPSTMLLLGAGLAGLALYRRRRGH